MNLDSKSRKQPQPLRARLRRAVADEILSAAEQVLGEQGVHAASVNEIAARAGVSVGTVYNHFADRKALVQALYRLRREELSPRIAELLEAHRHASFELRLRSFVRELLAVLDERRAFMRVAMEAEHLKPAEARSTRAQPVLIRLLDGVEELLTAGVAEGVVPPGDQGLAARFVVGGLKGVVHRALAEGTPFVTDAGRVSELILGAVRGRA